MQMLGGMLAYSFAFTMQQIALEICPEISS